MKAGRTRPREKIQARDEVLTQVMRAFWSTGFSATSMRELVSLMGVSTKSLYAHFGSKEALFTAAIERYIAGNEERYRERLAQLPLGLPNIERHFASYRFGADFEGCLLVNSLGERAQLPEVAVRYIDAFFQRVAELYEANLRAARDAGQLQAGADTRALAQALLVFDQGLATAGKSSVQRKHLAAAVRALLHSLS